MYTAQIDFPFKSDDDGEVLEWADLVLNGWRANGQILTSEWPMVERDHEYRFFVSLPELDSLDPKFAGNHEERKLEELLRVGGSAPIATILGQDTAGADCCDCSKRSCLVLHTSYVSLDSPLRCGDCFQPVPLYRIPPFLHDSRQAAITWKSDFQACDTLQMNCNTGERFGEREMREHDSSLSKRGREICRAIESVTKTPTYYCLFKMRGKSRKQERARRCPACQGAWLLEESLHKKFDFRCDPCRLLAKNFQFDCT